MKDPFNLQRFVEAQASIFEHARDELKRGSKSSHWMWFIFPQIEGLGRTAASRRYAISSLDEARAYLEHPILGSRLRECTSIVTQTEGRTARQIFGDPDDLKFRSSMTLFAHAAPDEPVFREALAKYYDSKPDPLTVERL